VDFNQLAADSLQTFKDRINLLNIKVYVSPELPTIYGDYVRLREVLENLIDNAIKYMENQPEPQIEIGKRIEGNEIIIYVKDNGIGIEPRFHTKIFDVFEKLNPAIDGTGIGLALIKRIIEVHGGRIWVESDGVGSGSTFFFTIPNQNNDTR
jgi:signal transduction histidine kinase